MRKGLVAYPSPDNSHSRGKLFDAGQQSLVQLLPTPSLVPIAELRPGHWPSVIHIHSRILGSLVVRSPNSACTAASPIFQPMYSTYSSNNAHRESVMLTASLNYTCTTSVTT
jgi:hypothetical protein